MHAGNSAPRRAAFLGQKLAMAPLARVLGERNAGISTLLRTVMHQPVFANVQVARARAAAPIVLASGGNIALETVDARERTLPERHDLLENGLLFGTQRLELAVAV